MAFYISQNDTTLDEAVRIDHDGKVGIGETSPLGKLHVRTADSSGTADSGADELVLENSGDTGMTILSSTSNSGSIRLWDSEDNDKLLDPVFPIRFMKNLLKFYDFYL